MTTRRIVRALAQVALLSVGACALRAADATPPPSWTLNFDTASLGDLSTTALKKLSPVPVQWSEGFTDQAAGKVGRCRIVEDGVASDRALEVGYPKDAVGPRVGGAQWTGVLSPRDSYTLEYRVRFSADFDWVLGGKLPGLGGGTSPTGGFFDPDGFTSRYMWREKGKLVVYFYWAGQHSSAQKNGVQYGEDLDTGVTMERGRDYVLRQRVTLNTPGRADGVLEVWVDGKSVLRRDDLLFRDTATKTWQIDRFFFSTFHGGNDPSWAPARDCSVRFDDFAVTP